MNWEKVGGAFVVVCASLLFIGATVYGIHAFFNGQAKAKAQKSNSKCDPNYSGYCVPNVSYDLDCKDIKHRVEVVGTDDNNFDADHDGIGCESY